MQRTVGALLFLVLLGAPARAESPADIANPQQARRSFVADNARVLDAQTVQRLDALIDGVKTRTGAEIAVVTVRSLGGMTVQDFASDLFNRWGIGGRSNDNGVLLLAAIGDRKLWIEVGDGAEADLTDGQAGQIYRSIITPRFQAGDFNGGVYNGTLAIAKRLDPSLASVNPDAPRRQHRARTARPARARFAVRPARPARARPKCAQRADWFARTPPPTPTRRAVGAAAWAGCY